MVHNLLATAKPSKYIAVILAIAACMIATTTLASITVTKNVLSSGTVTTTPNIGVYCESGCTTNMTSINWGTITAGGSATQTVYVKNIGNGAIALSLATGNWNPAAADTYISISWNQQGTQLLPGQSVPAIIKLTVVSSITGVTGFSNTIMISGTGKSSIILFIFRVRLGYVFSLKNMPTWYIILILMSLCKFFSSL
jgi:hypothetical protein